MKLSIPIIAVLIAVFATSLPGVILAATGATASKNSETEDQRWFQIEIILFAQQNNRALNAERWPEIEGLSLSEDLHELSFPIEEPEVIIEEGISDDQTEITPFSGLDETETSPIIFEPIEAIVNIPSQDVPPADMPLDMPVAYQMLENDAFQLDEVMQKIERARHLKAILHIAWQQPTVGVKNTTPVFIFDTIGEPLEENEVTLDETADFTEKQTPAFEIDTLPGAELFPLKPVYATQDDAKIGPRNPLIVGTIGVSVARYLHFKADLTYRIPVTQFNATPIPDLDLWYDRPYPTLHEPQGPAFKVEQWQAIRGFQLQQSRRMRSKVVHYLDHPFFGIIVLITPVELPTPAEDEVKLNPLSNLGDQ